MITTKGIIEKVEVDKVTQVTSYKVRMPMFHDTTNSSNVTVDELPSAIYPLPPHMERTTLNIGDIVMCTLEDGGLDNIVILGIIPSSSIPNTAGSMQTMSQVSMDNVQSISFDEKGSALLPYNIKIRTDDITNELIEGINRNYVNGEDLSYIRGLTAPVVELLEQINDTLNYLQKVLIRPEIQIIVEEPGKED